ncbi:MAG: adenine phosphoribosyltransferase [Planctomycetota bacterium]|jgi:adenine phosphoribosyltransferase|nr:adenine phosphoribosyltransferase [Planctomycetota bacterium]|tara:strand:- start:77090 stop:77644 length:555 start_codon:yes stop_codon:yes gene_type:complete
MESNPMTADPNSLRLEDYLRDVPDFPKPGIVFKDITPLLASPEAFRVAVERLTEAVRHLRPTHIAAIESRGFLFGTPMAERLKASIIPLRKPGKLPWKTIEESYNLEYGSNTLEVHVDGAGPSDRVVLVDDLLATGGTACASVNLIRRLGAEVVASVFAVELDFLRGRDLLHGMEVISLVHVDG